MAKRDKQPLSETHPHLAAEFDMERNAPLTPDTVTAGTDKKLWWICHTCSHEWLTKGYQRKRTGCPACSNKAIHSDGRNSMRATHPDLGAEFDLEKNSPLTPDTTIAGTSKKLWWICKTCSHGWIATGNDRFSGKGCPSCSGRSVHSDGRNSMRNTHPHLVAEFDLERNAPLTPDDVLAGTNKRLWWCCNECSHRWNTTGSSRSYGSETGCPRCSISGFDISKPGQYYVLRILNSDGETIYYKGGISSDHLKRVKQHRQNFSEHPRSLHWGLKLEEFYSSEGAVIRELERKLLLVDAIRGPSIDGLSSELFLSNPLEHARDMGWV